MRSPPPAPGGTGLAGRLALSARSFDGTASVFARFLTMHPGQPPSRPYPILRIGPKEAALRLQAILEPSKQYVIEEKKRDAVEADWSRPPPDGATPAQVPSEAAGGPRPPCSQEPIEKEAPMCLAEARSFAYAAHSGQLYGTLPYSAHLDAVAELVAPFGERAQAVAYLHDVVEDTATSAQVIRERFGAHVAECVALLTDAPGADRTERKAKTCAKLAKVSGPAELALVIKAADRLANVRACVAGGRKAKWEMYRAEHPAFRAAAHREGLCDSLWADLDALLASWPAG